MKGKLLSVLFVVILLAIVFSGCFEENNKQTEKQSSKLVTSPLRTLALTIDDLQQDYSEYYNGSEYASEFSGNANETFVIWFSRGDTSNPEEYDLVTCELNKFDSINESESAYETVINYMMQIGGFQDVDSSIDIIGEKSKALTKSGYPDIFSFRISNIICVMSSTDYSTTIDLANIVEQRIYNSIE